MKNKILIEVDDEQETPIQIKKPNEESQPQSNEEKEDMIRNDIETTCEGLMSLLLLASNSEIASERKNIRYVIKHLMSTFPQSEYYDKLKNILEEDEENNTEENSEDGT